MSRNSTRLLEIVDEKMIGKLLDSFNEATGLMAYIVDTEGQPVLEVNKQRNCKFCRLIWQYQKGFERCRGAYARAGKQAAQFGEPYIFRCPAGLIEWAAPIIIDGEHLGSIICGQVLMWDPEDFFWIELMEMNKGLGVDLEPLMEAAKELDVVSGQKVQAAADLLYVSANYIMNAGWENLRHRQELTRQQSILAEEIQNRKALETKLETQKISMDYSLEKERELVSKVKLGDKDAANAILEKILADIFIVAAAKMPVIKARILELVVVLSRTAVECGVEFEEALEINTAFVHKINKLSTIDEIDHAASKALQEYMDAVRKNCRVKNHSVIKEVKKYIRENFRKNLTLEDIAGAVFLSPYYLSHIFKEEQNMTVMNYLTLVRVEEAKKLLRNPQYNIEEISERLGYNDPSYFSKVFRRNEGKTPTQFRQQA